MVNQTAIAQIRGTVLDVNGKPIAYATVSIQNTTIATATNPQGGFELRISKNGKQRINIQNLGYKTKVITVDINSQPFEMAKILLEPEIQNLAEVVVRAKREDPANRIIKAAIRNRSLNGAKNDKFTADFYSRGLFQVKDMPKKILGQKVDQEEFMLDSTGSGILYLSETISKLAFQKPNKLNETIIASNVSGDNKGFSYNTAIGANFDFYENQVDLGTKLVSPLANFAFSYYRFVKESGFVNAGKTIYKIKVIPLRVQEPVVSGFIYIVEDTWEIYAVDFMITGTQMNKPIMDKLHLVQQYNYSQLDNRWFKSLQTIDFDAGALGLKFSGRFTHNFSNYNFVDHFKEQTFSNVLTTIQADANKKDTTYWKNNRPIPLTEIERNDYHKKDSIQEIRNSAHYLDSIDDKHNKFSPMNLITGYEFRHSKKHIVLNYNGIRDLTKTSFNTIQGWNFNLGLSAKIGEDEKGSLTSARLQFNYGLADKKLYTLGSIQHLFNRQSYDFLEITGGEIASQFNENEPISRFVNMISSLFFKDNYMKIYQKTFIKGTYSRNVTNVIKLSGWLEYNKRSPLINNTNYSFFKKDVPYLSNDPLSFREDNLEGFEPHSIYKLGIQSKFNFGRRVIQRPDERMFVENKSYPTLAINYVQAFSASLRKYAYQSVSAEVDQRVDFGNKGLLSAKLRGGKFFNSSGISFIDYQHFNGNQTHVGTSNDYLNNYLLLPYYTHSTNDAYFELHAEHNFNGFIMNKIPLLNRLNWHTIVGYHTLIIPHEKPYHELTAGFDNIGFGKFKGLRIDYVRSFQGSVTKDGIMIGLKVFNIFK
ncbi:DUF5686 and carboxypeptidase regulatory-like domain-containing protein [Sphingobacterium sp. SRCM116780]|uniref:DUF5686 and carboxypeptidase regulatory-like domain-containing protein n=1 Tax=Sphingobacterium sp. SRCM116780 TaxID=2907623 RepID=UPI001F27A89C|nr:DUF5686 and carboxypeptidase regulatory-like domain-containing protein [Sphingobacterium sp. SRCM116780]UIR55659.1 DUF5686 and carboxypeptidase regulatory-like domain-containing protein [Sphingobacterium sp. SRCM116780]